MSTHIPQIRLKFAGLQALGRDRLNLKQMAGRLGVKPVTLQGYLTSQTVPDVRLPALYELLVSQSPNALTTERAKALWLGGEAEFKSALLVTVHYNLRDVLEQVPQQLSVVCHIIPSGFGLDEEALEMGDKALPMHDATRFCLSAECKPKRKLIVLSLFASGWRVIAPGELHSGNVTSSRIQFPENEAKYLTFRANYGPRTYFFIEHDPGLDPRLPRSRDEQALHPEIVNQFGRLLQSPDWRNKWRWGSAMLRAADPSEPRER